MAPKLKSYEEKSYIHKGYETEQELKDEQAKLSKYQRKEKMKEVYETIKELRGEEDKTYEYMDKVRTSKEESLRNAPLHYSRGTYLADKEGKNVLEFDMAGSMAFYGLSNRGNYSIENTRQYVQYMGGKYLKDVFEEAIQNKKEPVKEKEIHKPEKEMDVLELGGRTF